MGTKTDLTNIVERMTAMEDRLNVELSGLSAFAEVEDDDIYLQIQGELIAKDGGELANNVTIQVVAYDDLNRVIGSDTCLFTSEAFFGVDVISVSLLDLPFLPTRIRIYPKPF
jgi:hypothetical protein